MRVQITEYLDIDLDEEVWLCNRCNHRLGSARENYKYGCLVHERSPEEIYERLANTDLNFAPDPRWCRLLEYYCPSCGLMIECEVLPPGHPITHDIDIDIDRLKSKLARERGTA
ncbi:MAG: acetone carboxylase subunit gamma [Aigarchaeota archaeon]|nr:acetone carboxylase subunit gamma [Aigarchaeota archaeon]MDW8092914.1 acetone carboxylase subunit gamma [Nitrososphaerota archaeon]